MRSFVVVAASCFSLACGDPESPTAASISSGSVAPIIQDYLSGTSQHVSAVIGYSGSTVATRSTFIASLGGEVLYDAQSVSTLMTIMPRDSVSRLTGASWIRTIELSDFPLDGADAGDIYGWGMDSIGIDEIHSGPAPGNLGAGVKIAILDNGVECNNPEFRRPNGLSIFVVGRNFNRDASGWCEPVVHGTAVTGILAAQPNGSGIVGVAPAASYYYARTTCSSPSGCLSNLGASAILSGLHWAREQGVDVINLSQGNCGWSYTPEMDRALSAAADAGITVVVAAGNPQARCEDINALARSSRVIAVGQHLENGGRQALYPSGPELDISAPTNVPATAVGGGTAIFGGTSASTPHVTGTVALLLASGFPRDPQLIRERLLLTSKLDPLDRIAGVRSCDTSYGCGLLNSRAAVGVGRAVGIVSSADPVTAEGPISLHTLVSDTTTVHDARYVITFSDPAVGSSISTGFLQGPFQFMVPPGSYSMTIEATPRERFYGRTGYPVVRTLRVCTDGGGIPPLIVVENGSAQLLGQGSVTPYRAGGC